MSEKRLNQELSAIEGALSALKPSASSVDRDRVMFLAGRASAAASVLLQPRRKILWLWPCITAVSLLLAIASNSMFFLQGTTTGDKLAALVKGGTHPSRNISQPLWYEDAQSSTPEENRPRPRPSTGHGDMQMDCLALTMLIAEKGVEALPGPLWIPMEPDKSPRLGPTLQDDLKLF